MILTINESVIVIDTQPAVRIDRTIASMIGTVTEVGGVPTGALIERGSSAAGEWAKWADGTLICWRTGLNVTNASTASGAIFRSSTNATWTFPQPFIVPPFVSVDCDSADAWGSIASAPTETAALVRAFSGISIATALAMRVMAVGRGF